MSHPLEISEVVGSFEKGRQTIEVCATATACFDHETAQLNIVLDAFLRPVDLLHPERREGAPWLPTKQSMREHVAWEESSQLARDIFKRWVKNVRCAIPPPA